MFHSVVRTLCVGISLTQLFSGCTWASDIGDIDTELFLTAITTDIITRVEMPAAVRLSLFLIQILNYMWIEAIFVNRREVGI